MGFGRPADFLRPLSGRNDEIKNTSVGHTPARYATFSFALFAVFDAKKNGTGFPERVNAAAGGAIGSVSGGETPLGTS